MKFGTYLAIYFLIWWLTLFAVLPFGIRNQEEAGDVSLGTDPGAPAIHTLWRKALLTTVISAVVFGALYFAYAFGLIPLEWLSRIAAPPR
jgi:predicted secreted protein